MSKEKEKEENEENEEKLIMFSIDENDSNLCEECLKEKAFINSDGFLLCRNCFYLQKKAILDAFIYKTTSLNPSYNQITEKIFLGNEDSAYDKKFLLDNNISNILICAEGCEIFFPDLFKYKILYLDDSPDEDLLIWLYEAFKFIDSSEKNIYIHCVMGISRSASIVISYLMFKNKWNYLKSFEFVKKKRNQIDPNSGFVEQLKKFEIIIKHNNYNIEKIKNIHGV